MTAEARGAAHELPSAGPAQTVPLRGDLRVRVVRGRAVLDEIGARLEDLLAATRAPVTARLPWLRAWIRCFDQYEPVAVLVESPSRMEAAALLARRLRLGLTEIVAVGHGPSDEIRFPARSDHAADVLAGSLASILRRLPGPWRLTVRHLPQGDRVATALAAALPEASLDAGDVSPQIVFGPDRSVRAYVSRNHHQQVRRMTNRMQRDGLEPLIEHLRHPHEIALSLAEVERVHRARDAALGRLSRLDDPQAGPFFRHLMLEMAARDQVVLTTLRLNGRLAAYTLCFLDDGAYRMWNCRFDPAFERYGPGRVANQMALENALADATATVFDWMRGDEPYKRSMANHAQRAVDLRAWSSARVRAVTDAPRRAKKALKDVKDRNETVERAWERLRRLRRRV